MVSGPGFGLGSEDRPSPGEKWSGLPPKDRTGEKGGDGVSKAVASGFLRAGGECGDPMRGP